MEVTQKQIDTISKMKFGLVYPMYLDKVEKKGRTTDELNQVISWLTGFSAENINELAGSDVNFKEFFDKADINPNATLITGVICGYRIEDIENDLVRNLRNMDKLVDELAKGKSMDKILRS